MAEGRLAEIVCVGDELLSGRVADLNAAWLGARLAESGWPVRRVVMVADELEAVVEAVRSAAARAGLVVVTGGLGGTSDDLTREALAALLGRPLHRDPELVTGLEARYAARGSTPTAGSLKMADVVEGAEVLPNPAGTAPGQRLAVDGATVVLLPGVPSEVRAIALDSLLPALAGSSVVRTRSLHLPMADESRVGDALAPFEAGLPDGVRIGYLAGAGSVEVRLTCTAPSVQDADDVLAPVLVAARLALSSDGRSLGSAVPAVPVLELPLPAHLVERLRERGETVAVAESLTGGLVAATLVAVPGASATLRGGVVAYATDLKASALDVPADLLAARGAVDPAVATAMAAGVREALGADWGLATTGVAGPDPQEGKPVGEVHLAVVGGQVRTSWSLALRGDRERIRTHASTAALLLLQESLR